MCLLITGGQSMLAGALADALAGEHSVRLVTTEHAAQNAPRAENELLSGDLRDSGFAQRAVEGIDAILHLAPLWPGLPPGTPDDVRLDCATRGTYALLNAAVAAGVRRVVLASTLDLFAAYPGDWHVSESWRPRPSSDVAQLAASLAEASAREISRVEPLHTVCLRLGEVVDDQDVAGKPYSPRWLHVSDAVHAFRRALAFGFGSRQFATTGPPLHGWWVFHIPGGGARTQVPLAWARHELFGYAPQHTFAAAHDPTAPQNTAFSSGASGAPLSSAAPLDVTRGAPRETGASRPIRRVVVFGAGGPLAAATTPLLAASYTLRATDLRSLRAIAADPRTAVPGRPVPPLLAPPHELREVDVTDPAQVMAACAGMDAIVNCSVVRPHPVNAFLVNTIGAYNIARAAVAHDIRRVVQTGPQQVTMDRPGGYWWDFDVPDDAPARPGSLLYSHSKYLGQEILRIFAENHSLEVPVLLFSRFVDPGVNRPNIDGMFPMTVSWRDAALAIRCALEAPALPSPCEVFHILANLPHGKYRNEKAKRLLGWQPQDTLEHLWGRRHTLEEEAAR